MHSHSVHKLHIDGMFRLGWFWRVGRHALHLAQQAKHRCTCVHISLLQPGCSVKACSAGVLVVLMSLSSF